MKSLFKRWHWNIQKERVDCVGRCRIKECYIRTPQKIDLYRWICRLQLLCYQFRSWLLLLHAKFTDRLINEALFATGQFNFPVATFIYKLYTINGTFARSIVSKKKRELQSTYLRASENHKINGREFVDDALYVSHCRIGCCFTFITWYHISRCRDYMLATGCVRMNCSAPFWMSNKLRVNGSFDRFSKWFSKISNVFFISLKHKLYVKPMEKKKFRNSIPTICMIIRAMQNIIMYTPSRKNTLRKLDKAKASFWKKYFSISFRCSFSENI